MTEELRLIKASIKIAFDNFDILLHRHEEVLADRDRLQSSNGERNAVIERQRELIGRLQRLVGNTPSSQRHMHGDPLLRSRNYERELDEGSSE